MGILSDDLVTYSWQRSNKITDKKAQMLSEIKLLERTKVYYCFNSKGETTKILPKTNQKSKYLAIFIEGNGL